MGLFGVGIGFGFPGCRHFKVICYVQAVETLSLSHCTLDASIPSVFPAFIIAESTILSIPPESTTTSHVLVVRPSGFLDRYFVCILLRGNDPCPFLDHTLVFQQASSCKALTSRRSRSRS